MQPQTIPEPPGERGRQVTVDLDGVHTAQTRQQWRGERGSAGTDFDQPVAGTWCYGGDDGLDRRAVHQEMLAESLARYDACLIRPAGHGQGCSSRYST